MGTAESWAWNGGQTCILLSPCVHELAKWYMFFHCRSHFVICVHTPIISGNSIPALLYLCRPFTRVGLWKAVSVTRISMTSTKVSVVFSVVSCFAIIEPYLGCQWARGRITQGSLTSKALICIAPCPVVSTVWRFYARCMLNIYWTMGWPSSFAMVAQWQAVQSNLSIYLVSLDQYMSIYVFILLLHCLTRPLEMEELIGASYAMFDTDIIYDCSFTIQNKRTKRIRTLGTTVCPNPAIAIPLIVFFPISVVPLFLRGLNKYEVTGDIIAFGGQTYQSELDHLGHRHRHDTLLTVTLS